MLIKALNLLLINLFFICTPLKAVLLVGVGQTEITPPIGTPSAGYMVRERKMEGVLDPLLATAIVIDTGDKKLAICTVDHLGYDHRMIEEIKAQLPDMDIIVAASHTHSGTGAYLDIPVIGEMLAGPFDPKIRRMLIDEAAFAIKRAAGNLQEAKMGIGYGKCPGLNRFRSSWPLDTEAPDDLAVIHFVSKEDKTLAVLFNFAVHPTTLSSKNKLYSADFVGFARNKIQKELGGSALFLNGAQGEIAPNPPYGKDEYEKCQVLGEKLGIAVTAIASKMDFQEEVNYSFTHYPYTFDIKPTSSGLKLPLDAYDSELNVLIFNHKHAFVTVPGELSCLYAHQIRLQSPFENISIFGLVNDAHGYILAPDAFEHKTPESSLSFGGPDYGEWVFKQLLSLLQAAES